MTMNKLIPLIVLSCLLPRRQMPEPSPPPAIPRPCGEQIRQQAREGVTTYRITEARMGNSAYHGENRGLKHRRQAQG